MCHISLQNKDLKPGYEDLGYKKADRGISFAEVALLGSMEHNRSAKMLERIRG